MEEALSLALRASLQPLAQQREAAERQLVLAAAYPTYASSLTSLLLSPHLPTDERQLAAVVLRQFINSRWCEADGSGGGEPPPPSPPEEEKASIRRALPQGLADPAPRMRTAVSMVIASIAAHDWPEEWPQLMPQLIEPLRQATSNQPCPHTLAGVLRCLELCSSELQEEHLPQATPPCQHALVSTPHPTPHHPITMHPTPPCFDMPQPRPPSAATSPRLSRPPVALSTPASTCALHTIASSFPPPLPCTPCPSLFPSGVLPPSPRITFPLFAYAPPPLFPVPHVPHHSAPLTPPQFSLLASPSPYPPLHPPQSLRRCSLCSLCCI